VADPGSGGSVVRGGGGEKTDSGVGVPESHCGSGDGECGKGTQWMGTPSETDAASEVVQDDADGAGSGACVVTADGAGSAACVITRRGACGGGGGWDCLPMRNSHKSASSSWIPAMVAPCSRSIYVTSKWLKGRESATAELGGV
jgi:hypothetical protein